MSGGPEGAPAGRPGGAPGLDRLSGVAEAVGIAVIGATLLAAGGVLFAAFGLAGVLASEVLVVGLPSLAGARLAGLGVRDALRLRPPAPRHLAAAIALAPAALVGASAFLSLQVRLLPMPPELTRAWLDFDRQVAAAPGLAVAALILAPAVAEEALFRGLLFRLVERSHGAGRAIVATALLFALFHLSVYRLVPQLGLGLLLGLLAARSGSLAPPIALHLVYNLGVLAAGDVLTEHATAPAVAAGAALCGAGGAWLLRESSLHKSNAREISPGPCQDTENRPGEERPARAAGSSD